MWMPDAPFAWLVPEDGPPRIQNQTSNKWETGEGSGSDERSTGSTILALPS